ncbi:hypothetical protein TSAR_004602 [Trichomalopsis sarcophagae]|uniref:chymotrypsin n=1 Tax=Trichomalopsis sarcophagae TaxID=543379 RepID=A0A232EEZ2_9HYME|nr:hypothetical protein TSAR_004602 [Trichomalopsis sarcophagae]
MKKIVFVLFGLLALTQGTPTGRVVNGEDAELGDRPFQVSLQTYAHFCGGSIVSENWVVTAAHCVYGTSASGVNVVVGTVSLKNPHKSHPAEKIIVHEAYAPTQSNRNDIALIKVSTPFEFSDIVAPVPLADPNVKVKTNSTAVLSGWGGTWSSSSPTPDRLQKASIYVADQEYCRTVMASYGREIFPTNICANDPSTRRGQCNGDSGGPLTVDGKLTGIVSWSIKDPYCASTKYPGVYTRVSAYVDWIAEHTK